MGAGAVGAAATRSAPSEESDVQPLRSLPLAMTSDSPLIVEAGDRYAAVSVTTSDESIEKKLQETRRSREKDINQGSINFGTVPVGDLNGEEAEVPEKQIAADKQKAKSKFSFFKKPSLKRKKEKEDPVIVGEFSSSVEVSRIPSKPLPVETTVTGGTEESEPNIDLAVSNEGVCL
jgi:hypothetical protein